MHIEYKVPNGRGRYAITHTVIEATINSLRRITHRTPDGQLMAVRFNRLNGAWTVLLVESDREDLPIDVRAARLWYVAMAVQGVSRDDRARDLRMQVRRMVDRGSELDNWREARQALDSLIRYVDALVMTTFG